MSAATTKAQRRATITQIAVDRVAAAAMLDISVSSLEARVRDGTLPQPRMIGGSSRWLVSELHASAEALPVSSLLPPTSRRAGFET